MFSSVFDHLMSLFTFTEGVIWGPPCCTDIFLWWLRKDKPNTGSEEGLLCVFAILMAIVREGEMRGVQLVTLSDVATARTYAPHIFLYSVISEVVHTTTPENTSHITGYLLRLLCQREQRATLWDLSHRAADGSKLT